MHSALAAEVDQALATVVVPLDAIGRPLRARVGLMRDPRPGRHRHVYVAYWDRDPQPREFFGPLFDYPRECIAFVDDVNGRAA